MRINERILVDLYFYMYKVYYKAHASTWFPNFFYLACVTCVGVLHVIQTVSLALSSSIWIWVEKKIDYCIEKRNHIYLKTGLVFIDAIII